MRIFFILLLVCSNAMAGLMATGTVTENGKESKMKQYFDGANFRMDFIPGGNQKDVSLIYRGATGTVNFVEPARKTYVEMNDQDLERLLALTGAFMNRGKNAVKPGEAKYEKKGTAKVGSWKCTQYDVLIGGKKTGTLCVIPPSQVGGNETDMKGLSKLAATLMKLGPLAPAQGGFITPGLDEALKLGFIVEATSVDAAGKQLGRYVIDSAAKEAHPATTFSAPTGYQRTDIMAALSNLMMKKK